MRILSIFLYLFIFKAQATLIDLGVHDSNLSGLIYDTEQDLTWLMDANYTKTNNYSLANNDGRMTWEDAQSWVGQLKVGGYDDWRLPTVGAMNVNQPSDCPFVGGNCGYNVNILNSELAYLWYEVLGNKAYYDESGVGPQSGWGLESMSANGVGFLNMQSNNYWLKVTTSQGGNALNFRTGNQTGSYYGMPNIYFYAIGVRSGRAISSIPEPSTLAIFLLGMVGLASRRFKRH
jgi:hypothetical protein